MAKTCPHIYQSSMVSPQLDPKTFCRGWLTETEQAVFVGSLEEASAYSQAFDFVQLGVQYAGSVVCAIQVLNRLRRRSNVIGVDVDAEAQERFREEMSKLKSEFATPKFVLGKSYDMASTVERAAWVFVDACHCRECVEKDIAVWAPKVDNGGLILFHDCDARVSQRSRASQKMTHNPPRPAEVYEAMMGSAILRRDFYLVHFLEGATDKHNEYWDGLAVWRRRA